MTINDPIVILGLGCAIGVASWIIRTALGRLDRRIATLEEDVDALQTQMAAHDGNKEMLDRMYLELRALADLTHRIAGHLNVS